MGDHRAIGWAQTQEHHQCERFFKEAIDAKTCQLLKLKFPTVSVETIIAVLNIAALKNLKGFTMDIPRAFLNAELKEPTWSFFRA